VHLHDLRGRPERPEGDPRGERNASLFRLNKSNAFPIANTHFLPIIDALR
jgi:hypothetical protein